MTDDNEKVVTTEHVMLMPAACLRCGNDVEIHTDAWQSSDFEYRAESGDDAYCTTCGEAFKIEIGPYLTEVETSEALRNVSKTEERTEKFVEQHLAPANPDQRCDVLEVQTDGELTMEKPCQRGPAVWRSSDGVHLCEACALVYMKEELSFGFLRLGSHYALVTKSELEAVRGEQKTAFVLAQRLEKERDAADYRAFVAKKEASQQMLVAEHGEPREGSMLQKIFEDLSTWRAAAMHEKSKRQELEELIKVFPPLCNGFTSVLELAADTERVKNYVTTQIDYLDRMWEVTFHVPGGMTPAEHLKIKNDELALLKQELDRLIAELAVVTRERNIASSSDRSKWLWSDTDDNDLESLADDAVLSMTASQLRQLLAHARSEVA